MSAFMIVFLVIEGAAAALLIAIAVGMLRDSRREKPELCEREQPLPDRTKYVIRRADGEIETVWQHSYGVDQAGCLRLYGFVPGSYDRKCKYWEDKTEAVIAAGQWVSIEEKPE